ncbi:DUF6263 family protein [Aureivirga sp. CE67]|uniref:DUF6263 family protein n=1 Tax=Aureivirga sp. CE67 TaxID=1788983 RepID=UPI0018C8E5CF|nr:DUF6263 family protein [Aureivirga sp. CE67]
MKKAILLVILLSSFSVFSQKVKLELNLKKGETYLQNSNIESLVHQNVNGVDVDVKMNIQSLSSFLVLEELENGYLTKCTIEKIATSVNMPGNSVTLSSEDESALDPTSKFYRLLKTESFLVTISKKGKVISFENLDSLFDRTFKKGDFSNLEAAQLKQIFEASFNEKKLRGSMEIITKIFPGNNKNKIGDTWEFDYEIITNTNVHVNSKYTLTEIDKKKTYTIEGNGTMKTDPNADFIPTNGFYAKPNLSGTIKSIISIDAKTGWIIKSTIIQELDGNTEIKTTPEGPVEMKVPMKTTTETIITDI